MGIVRSDTMMKISGFQAIKQSLFAKGLAQESDCPCGQHLGTRRLIGMPRNNDCRYREAIGPETFIELHTAQAWHVHIGDQT